MLTNNFKNIEDIYNYVCDKLYGKVIIHSYKAYSTNSIYLKFDYGAANSLRISDHPGKKHLDYRFNILMNINECSRVVSSKGYVRDYYPKFMVDDCINSIVLNKQMKLDLYQDYYSTVEKLKSSIDRSTGFWSNAKLYTGRR